MPFSLMAASMASHLLATVGCVCNTCTLDLSCDAEQLAVGRCLNSLRESGRPLMRAKHHMGQHGLCGWRSSAWGGTFHGAWKELA